MVLPKQPAHTQLAVPKNTTGLGTRVLCQAHILSHIFSLIMHKNYRRMNRVQYIILWTAARPFRSVQTARSAEPGSTNLGAHILKGFFRITVHRYRNKTIGPTFVSNKIPHIWKSGCDSRIIIPQNINLRGSRLHLIHRTRTWHVYVILSIFLLKKHHLTDVVFIYVNSDLKVSYKIQYIVIFYLKCQFLTISFSIRLWDLNTHSSFR